VSKLIAIIKNPNTMAIVGIIASILTGSFEKQPRQAELFVGFVMFDHTQAGVKNNPAKTNNRPPTNQVNSINNCSLLCFPFFAIEKGLI
jgi:hypothetical protein